MTAAVGVRSASSSASKACCSRRSTSWSFQWVWPWDPGHWKQQRIKGFTEQTACPDGHRAKGVAVISPVEGNELLTCFATVVPPLHGRLQRHFHGCGSVVGEEHPVQACAFRQALRQPFRLGMGEFGEDHLLQGGGLVRDRRSHHRVGMAMQRDPPTADGID